MIEQHKIAGRVLPQALDSEAYVIAALMWEKGAWWRVCTLLTADCFHKAQHALIWKACERLKADEDRKTDLESVAAELRKMGRLEDAGGIYGLSEISDRAASGANIEYHAFIIHEMHGRRKQIEIGHRMIDAAYALADPHETATWVASEMVQALSVTGTASKSAAELVAETIADLSEMERRKKEANEKGEGFITGVPSGYRQLDIFTEGFQPADLVVIGARPSMGKTALALGCSVNAADKDNPVGIFSLEMKDKSLMKRLLAIVSGVDGKKIRGASMNQDEWVRVQVAAAKVAKMPIYIDDTSGLSIMDLSAKARAMHRQHGIKMIMVDYLTLMNAGKGYRGNKEQEVDIISKGLKAIAKELNIPVIVLSQLNRAVETRGGDKKPMLSDLRHSGSIEQDADVVMFLYRPEYYGLDTYEDGESTKGVAEILVAKQREGPTGDAKLGFHSLTTKFYNLDEGPPAEPAPLDPRRVQPSTKFTQKTQYDEPF